jgi:hypothetical protein
MRVGRRGGGDTAAMAAAAAGLMLAARVRLLATGAVNKNDPNDARSVAVAALRSAACPQVRADDHAAVLTVWATP